MEKELGTKENIVSAKTAEDNSAEYATEHILNGNACVECGFKCIQGCV